MLALVLLLRTALATEPAPAEAPAEAPAAEPAEPAEAPPAEPATDETTGEEPAWIELSAPADFGSALRAQDTGALTMEPEGDTGTLVDLLPEADTGSLVALLPPHLQLVGQQPGLRGRWALRPWLGVQGLGARWGGEAGANLGHQWWSLREGAVRPAGETRLRATGLFGAVRGYDLRLDSTHGLWLGPVGLLVGPALRLDRRAAALPTALSLGPQGRLALRAGPLVPWVAATPAWHLAGTRAPLADSPWHELSLAAGLALDRRPVGLRLSGEWRPGLSPSPWSAALGLHLRLL